MTSNLRSLIINADDFGYNDAITQGILLGYREGLITTTSAMVNTPGAPERVAIAHAHEPTLPIGLHLNMTAGRPVLPAARVRHLVRPDGTFFPMEAVYPRLSEIPLDEVRAEATAQAELLLEWGVSFDHIDYHGHFMALSAPLFEIVVEMAGKYHVPVRQPILKVVPGRFMIGSLNSLGDTLRLIPSTFVRYPYNTMRFLREFKSHRQLRQVAAKLGSPDWFISAFFADPTLGNFSAILHQLPPGLSELMVHPALQAPELYTMDEGYRAERPKELGVLLNPRARLEVERQAIRLTNFSAAINPDNIP